MPDPPAILIAAASGRALAQSARHGGYLPLVADFFADQDTAALAHDHVQIEHGLTRGMNEAPLLAAFETLARSRQPIGAVCGTGFEDRPELLARIGERWRLLGNDPHIVATVKDPRALATLCGDCAIPHPETVPSLRLGLDPAGWLAKRKGGAGGSHIASAVEQNPANGEFYFQRTAPGVPVSALFLADGRRAMTIGFSTQWASPTVRRPFRYGGAVRPAALAPALASTLADAVDRLVQAIPLVGLNSADFLVDGVEFRLLEINPRPGATLDVFEPAEGSLFALHVAACQGELDCKLDCPPLRFAGACAAAIVYAERDIAAVPAVRWPDWTADRPRPGTAIKAGEPLCTVKAATTTAAAARVGLDRRFAMVLAMVLDWTHARMS
jgi:predicted ATP-grasp superfamily ATP-dependent carboligase